VVVLFPDSNLRTAKGRPALIVQADNLGTGIQQTIVAMRSCLSRLRLARDTRRQKDRLEEGFDYHDDNLTTVFENEIDRAIGSWPDMAAVDAALRHTLGL